MSEPIYALNLFEVSDKQEYLAYSRRSAREVHTHGGRVVALGKFREAITGEIKPRPVLILVKLTTHWWVFNQASLRLESSYLNLWKFVLWPAICISWFKCIKQIVSQGSLTCR